MKRISLLKTALCLSLGLVMSGCMIRSPVVPPVGMWYNETTFPVDITFGPNDIGPTSGSSDACSVLGLVAWGDASVESAAKSAGIKQIDHVDAYYFNVLGVYMKYETTVYGKTADQIKTPTPTSKAPAAASASQTGG